MLAYAAAVTDRVRLGTSVLVAPWYQPALLARSLASLDLLSDGRLTIGLGLGASPEEYKAVGVPHAERGRRLEEALDVLDAAWAAAPGPRDRPPVLLAGTRPTGSTGSPGAPTAGTRRACPSTASARCGPRSATWPRATAATPMGWSWWCGPTSPSATSRSPGRPSYHGTVDQVADDLHATRAAGAHEVILGLDGDHCLHEVLEYFAALAEAIDLTGG